MRVSDVTKKSNIRAFVKDHLFHLVKFWKPIKYGEASFNKKTICGWFAHHHNIQKTQGLRWWKETAFMMARMHTDQRNNVIKAIKKAYRGTSVLLCVILFYLVNTHT